MHPWFEKHRKYTALEIKAWNSAIPVAGEFVRQFNDYDETRSLTMLNSLINKD